MSLRRTTRLNARRFTAIVRAGDACPARLCPGDSIVVENGKVNAKESSRICMYAVADLVPFLRRMDREVQGGRSPEKETVLCNHCRPPGSPLEFVIQYDAHDLGGFDERDADLLRTVQALKRFELFKSLDTPVLKRLANRTTKVELDAGQVIIQEGDLGERLYLVDRGEVEVLRTDEEGEEIQLATIGRGSCFGEMSLLTGEPISATVKATNRIIMYTLEKSDFEGLLLQAPELNVYFTGLLCERLRKTTVSNLANLRSGMSGSLEALQPTELFQAMHLTERSGRLSLRNADVNVKIVFEQGQPWQVDCADNDPEEAVYTVLGWTTGSFRFDAVDETPQRSFFKDLTGLLLEGMRRKDLADMPPGEEV